MASRMPVCLTPHRAPVTSVYPPMDGGEAGCSSLWRDPLAAETWFTNYNEGQGQSYLEAQAFAYPEGDPDFEPALPSRLATVAISWMCGCQPPRRRRRSLCSSTGVVLSVAHAEIFERTTRCRDCSTPASPWRRSATGGPIGTQHLPCVQDRKSEKLSPSDYNAVIAMVTGSTGCRRCGLLHVDSLGSRPGAARSC